LNRIEKSTFSRFISRFLTLLSAVLLACGTASAREHKVKGSDAQAQVVAHISFHGLAAVDMAIQKKADDRYYLYVQHGQDQGISVIDIGKPGQPKAVGLIPWPDPAREGRMNLTGGLAIIAERSVLSLHRSTSSDDLVLWDLSNPAAPRVVQEFSGVVRWLRDERDFVYVLNGDGLWVISQPAERQPDKTEASTYWEGGE
jgi:hypothetical protein